MKAAGISAQQVTASQLADEAVKPGSSLTFAPYWWDGLFLFATRVAGTGMTVFVSQSLPLCRHQKMSPSKCLT